MLSKYKSDLEAVIESIAQCDQIIEDEEPNYADVIALAPDENNEFHKVDPLQDVKLVRKAMIMLKKKLETDSASFKPKYDEIFYVVLWFGNKLAVSRLAWKGDASDWSFLKVGNCFRTRKEAEANVFKIYKELTGKEWVEKDEG